ncbi:MAG: glycosyltransferase family 1 protein [Ignavibacteriales bacterium]|nr:glycosyltransferase family 1 protein [Ignavibacteriales bacterium]
MRIAYFNANLCRGQDGVTRVMYKMFEAALARHHEPIAFTSTRPDPEDRIVPMHKVRSVVLPLQKSYRIAFPGYQMFAKSLDAFAPDIMHINSPCTLGFAAMKYARQFSIPVVATYHTHFPTYPRYYGLTALEELAWKVSRYLYNKMDRTFVPTTPILDELREHSIDRLEYLPNGVDLNLFNPSRWSLLWRENISPDNKPVVLFVSRLVWEKDLAVLAQAYQILRQKRTDFEMVIVGDGHARKEFQDLMPGAHFLGYQSGLTLAESYASSDIFVFPSTTETFGLVTIEAMASGLAPIAAKVGGATGIIQEGKSGLFAKPLSGEDLAHGVDGLLDEKRMRQQLAEGALQRAQEFSWEKILSQLFDSYQSVINEHKRQHARAA